MAERLLPELSEAETQSRFDELLDRAECGEAFIITRNGGLRSKERTPP